ncbi:MAG: ABC transporter substrate-binding protein [Nevskiales bacterium]|nr:ABC transporter substrate-binding protein [Nevskiales bacterium]
MSHHSNNPFIRGYDGLSVQRLLAISYDDDCPLSYLPLHTSQSHLPDSQVERHACIFCDDFALITEGQNVPPELGAQCRSPGIARNLVYAVMAEEAGKPLHVGDTYTHEAATDVVRRLRFETGFYSRCWEISSAHITDEASRYLANLADIDTPIRFLFVAFRIPYSPAVGVKLISTPWTDAHLQFVEGITAERLRQEHRKKGMPESLIEVLHLAGLADVRVLVFDADAPVLDGLTLYDE